MAKFNVDKAIKAGYSQQEIDQFVNQNGLEPIRSVAGFGRNAVSSAGNFVGGTVSGVANLLNPDMEKNTGYQLLNLATGIVDSLLPGEQGNEKYAEALVDYFKQRYGGIDNIANTFYSDPVGMIDDVSMVLTAGGSAAKSVGKLGKLDNLARVGSGIQKAGMAIDPLILAGKGIGKVGQGINKVADPFAKKVSKYLTNEADYAPLRGLGKNKLTEGMLAQIKKSGMTPTEFFDEYKLWNRDIDEVNKVLGEVNKSYKSAAYKSGKMIDVKEVVDAFDKKISQLEPAAKQSTNARLQLKTVMEQKQAFLDTLVNNNASPIQANIGKLAESKSFVGQDIPNSTWNMGAVSKGKAAGSRKTYGLYKGLLDTKTSGKTAKLGAAESALFKYKDLLKKAETGRAGNKQISFQKIIAPTAGGIAGGLPGAAAGYAFQQFANSPTGLKAYSKVTKTAGEAIKGTKPLNIKLPKNTSNVYKGAKTTRFIERVNEKEKKNPFRQILL